MLAAPAPGRLKTNHDARHVRDTQKPCMPRILVLAAHPQLHLSHVNTSLLRIRYRADDEHEGRVKPIDVI